MAEYVIGSPGDALRIGVLPSAFNPPTVAHLALASAAERNAHLDQVVFALPRELPHKSFDGASLEQRCEMLCAALADQPGRALALTEGGLFVEMAREVKLLAPPEANIFLICGKDAAERIADWDYGQGPTFEEQLQEFTLLVGDRDGRYRPDPRWGESVRTVPLAGGYDPISSASLRLRRCRNQDWQSLTVPAVVRLIEQWDLYRRP